jgi:hypothetical protein
MDDTIHIIPNDAKLPPYTDITAFPSNKIDFQHHFNKIDKHSHITIGHDITPTKLFNDMKYQKLDHTVPQTTLVPNTTGTKQQFNTNFDMLATQIVDLNRKFDQFMESLQQNLTSTNGNKVTPKKDTTTEVEIVLNTTKQTTLEDAQQHQQQTPQSSKITTQKEKPINQWNIVDNKRKSLNEVPNMQGKPIKTTSVKKRPRLKEKTQKEQKMANKKSNKSTETVRLINYEEQQYKQQIYNI